MGNVLEFYLKMKDMMSSGLIKVAQTAKQSFGKVQNYISSSIDKGSKDAVTSLDKIKGKIREVDQTASKSSFFGGGLLRRFGPAALLGGALALGTSSVSSAMNYGATTKSFEVLTGSKQKGGDLANSLNQLQQDTILGPEVFKSAQTLMGFGIAADKVMKIERELGDVSMGNKEKFESLTLAFAQTQAAGKLMGQDLLQYINAGFNPLQTMSERWKDFGFKQKVSVGELKKAMESGKISAEMVAKAFELATTKGGKFNGMMDAIAQTSYGKLQILEGQWENFKIQSGNALMPLADILMGVASKTMDWLNITKTAPQVLIAEKGEISSLVGVVTSLNEKNDLRHQLLQQLVVKYPDLFGKMDIEKVKNSELLSLLNDINGAYEKRISLSTSDLIVDTNKKVLQDAQSDFTKYATVLELMKRGDGASVSTAKKLLSIGDMANLSTGLAFSSKPTENDKSAVALWMRKAQQTMGASQSAIVSESGRKKSNEFLYTLQDSYALAQSGDKMTALFGKTKEGLAKRAEFQKLASQIDVSKGTYYTHGGGLDFAAKLKNLITPSSATKNADTKVGGALDTGKDGTTKGITSGGPRVININGVNMKFADKIEVHANNPKELMAQLEPQMEDYWLRLLNSGSSTQ